MLRNSQLAGGLSMFFFQFFIQAGVFFTIPLFLSVVLELSALQTGVRLLPLSFALLAAAVGIPRLAPRARPRLIVRLGLASMTAGTLVLIGGISPGADAGIVTIPMLLMGLGIGALASQLGAVTVSAVPDRESAEVGGLQNTVTNLGASLGTALVGAVLIASLTTGLIHGVQASSAIPARRENPGHHAVRSRRPVHLRHRPEGPAAEGKRPARTGRRRGHGQQRRPPCRIAHLAVGRRAARRRRHVLHRLDPRQANRTA